MKHSLIKQNIIETASDLFYKNGYNLTGINEIIRESGIAKATLYNHFKSKDDICLAYLNYKNSAFLTSIEAFCAKAPKGKGQLLSLFDFLENFFDSKDFNGCWCINTISEIPAGNEKIINSIQFHKQQFISFIEKLISANFTDNSAKKNTKLAKRIYLLYESAVSESHLHQNKWPIASTKEICQLILE